jgi:hypothetical protein
MFKFWNVIVPHASCAIAREAFAIKTKMNERVFIPVMTFGPSSV